MARRHGLRGHVFAPSKRLCRRAVTASLSAEAATRAHDHPDIADIWERMRPLCEIRHGLPVMEFPHFRPFPLA